MDTRNLWYSNPWLAFYERFGRSLPRQVQKDPALLHQQLSNVVEAAVEDRAKHLRKTRIYQDSKLQVAVSGLLPMLKIYMRNKVCKDFAKQALRAFGLDNRKELKSLGRDFEYAFNQLEHLLGSARAEYHDWFDGDLLERLHEHAGDAIADWLSDHTSATVEHLLGDATADVASEVVHCKPLVGQVVSVSQGYITTRERLCSIIQKTKDEARKVHKVLFVSRVVTKIMLEIENQENEEHFMKISNISKFHKVSSPPSSPLYGSFHRQAFQRRTDSSRLQVTSPTFMHNKRYKHIGRRDRSAQAYQRGISNDFWARLGYFIACSLIILSVGFYVLGKLHLAAVDAYAKTFIGYTRLVFYRGTGHLSAVCWMMVQVANASGRGILDQAKEIWMQIPVTRGPNRPAGLQRITINLAHKSSTFTKTAKSKVEEALEFLSPIFEKSIQTLFLLCQMVQKYLPLIPEVARSLIRKFLDGELFLSGAQASNSTSR